MMQWMKSVVMQLWPWGREIKALKLRLADVTKAYEIERQIFHDTRAAAASETKRLREELAVARTPFESRELEMRGVIGLLWGALRDHNYYGLKREGYEGSALHGISKLALKCGEAYKLPPDGETK